MVSTDIEKMAVLKVQEEILRNKEYLSEYINSNDKTPMWDGNIYVYNNERKEKEFYQGKIETQVKGETVKRIKNGNSKYQMEIETLEAYKKDQKGTLLLVCKFIDLDNYQLYYANLLPIDLEAILDKAKYKNKKGKDKISIDIKPIKRNSISSLKNICLNFLRESKKQFNIKIMNIQDLKNVKKFDFQITGIQKENELIEYMLNNDIYTYATCGDNNEIIALKKSILYSVETKEEHQVMINNILYYNTIRVMHTQKKEIFKLGKGIIIDENKITIKPTGNIYERINDLEFFLNLYKYKKIRIDEEELEVPFYKKTENDEITNRNQKYLNWLRKVEQILNKFNVCLDFDLNLLSDEDIKNINNLINAYNGKFFDIKSFNSLYYTKFYKYKLIYIIRKCEDGQIDIIDYYSDLSNILKMVLNFKDEEIIVSPYLQLTVDDLLDHINFKDEVVKKTFNDIDIRAEDYIVQFILNCIRAYDKDNNKNNLLELALYVNNKLLEKSQTNINIINKLQIVKRMRKLEENEINQLIEIRDNEKDIRVKAGVSILIESNLEFNKYYNDFTVEEKKEFEQYPIFNLKK